MKTKILLLFNSLTNILFYWVARPKEYTTSNEKLKLLIDGKG